MYHFLSFKLTSGSSFDGICMSLSNKYVCPEPLSNIQGKQPTSQRRCRKHLISDHLLKFSANAKSILTVHATAFKLSLQGIWGGGGGHGTNDIYFRGTMEPRPNFEGNWGTKHR